METNTEFITYKGVNITNIRNAATGGNKIQIRDIAITYIADKFSNGGEGSFGASSLARAQAIIDWLLNDGATVTDGRIVTTATQFDTCLENYWKLLNK